MSNFKNVTSILAATENHLANRTTVATWEFVNRFWTTDIDLGASAQQIVDRITLLEGRMKAQHGWAR